MNKFWLIFALVGTMAFIACQSNTNKATEAVENKNLLDREVPKIPNTTTMDPAQLANLDGDLLAFWSRFKKNLRDEGVPLVRYDVHFPLEGGGLFTKNVGINEPIEEAIFQGEYFNIFDPHTRDYMVGIKAVDLKSSVVEVDDYRGSIPEKLGISIGSKIYFIKVPMSEDSENVDAQQWYKVFHFGKIDGQYKLAWLSTEDEITIYTK